MKLFELDDKYNVNIDPELFLLKDFANLRDARKGNIDLLYKELSFIWFYCDMNSDFQFQTNKTEKVKDIVKQVDLNADWEPDELVNKCIELYQYLSQTISSKLLKSVYISVDKVRNHLENLDLSERDPKSNKPIFNQKDVIASVKQIPSLLKAIAQAEDEFIKNKDTNEKLRGEKMMTLYEKGFDRID